MARNIYLIGGSKGGVGKSLVTMAMIDYLKDRGESALLIESDTSNLDVWKANETLWWQWVVLGCAGLAIGTMMLIVLASPLLSWAGSVPAPIPLPCPL